jgi:succinoglycan biosynthesis transport protein ExoP
MSKNFELLSRVHRGDDLISSRPRRRSVASPPVVEQSGWLRFRHVLQHRWGWSVIFAALVLIAAGITTHLMSPIYEPQSRIEIDPPGAEAFSLQSGTTGYDQSDYVETQAQELQSDEAALAVIRKLKLQRNVEFNGSMSSRKRSMPTEASAMDSENRALAAFRERLKVQRDSASRLITLSFAAHDPRLAAEVTNTLVNDFIDMSYKNRHAAVLKSADWLSKQLDDLRAKVQESNRALADFQNTSGIASIDETQNTFSEKISELNRQLSQAQAERIQHEAFVQRLNADGEAQLPQLSSDPVIQDLTKQASETRAALSQAMVIYGKNNPHAVELQRRIDELESQIARQRKIVLGNLTTNYRAARARELLLQSEINDASKQSSEMARYFQLKKEAQANTDLYNQLYAKVKEAGISAESKSTNIRVIDPARVLSHPTRPNWKLNMLAALGAGLIGGIALAFVRDAMDRSLRTPDDIKQCTGLCSVSVVPVIGAAEGLLRSHRSYDRKFLLDRPHSPESEALLGLHTSLRLSAPGSATRVLLIASPFSGDGKTTVAANLAIAEARHGKTCLVDADMRKTGVAKLFGLSAHTGLAQVLEGRASLEQAMIRISDIPNLMLLPGGTSSEHPGELLSQSGMGDLLRALRESFEFVVIDAPPILSYADARCLAVLVDGVVLVGRAGRTTKEALIRSIEILSEIHAPPVLEVVLNGASHNAWGYGYYGYYDYGNPRAR